MRSVFVKQLEELYSDLVEMGALAEHAISNASDALKYMDRSKARSAIEFDRKIDVKEADIENMCMKLLLHQQPVAHDLLLISAALRMIRDMERIGDQATDIAEIVMHMDGDVRPYDVAVHLPAMAELAKKMVKCSIDAFIRSSVELVEKTIAADDEMDALFIKTRDDMVKLVLQKPDKASVAMDLLMTAKYYERIGDHAENIAEWAEYSVLGKHRSEKL